MDELKFSFPTEFDVLFQIQNFFPRHGIVRCFGFVPSSVGGEIWNLICIVFWKKGAKLFEKELLDKDLEDSFENEMQRCADFNS